MIRYVFFLVAILSLITSCKEAQIETDVTIEVDKQTLHASVEEDSIGIDFITGKFKPALDSSFVLIAAKYADREGMYLKREAYDAFVKMWKAAKEEGVHLIIRSATRNFDYQKSIWEKKWTGKTLLSDGSNALKDYDGSNVRALKILEYSSMPGTSRHHWGTEVDLNMFNNEWFESGEGMAVFQWLEANAETYGFCRPYTAKGELRPNGYNEEKWHWSYMPLSKQYTKYAEENLKNEYITGFLGSSVSEELNVVNNYVLGISHECK